MKKLREKMRSSTLLKVISYILIPIYIFMCLLTVEYLNFRNLGDLFYMWRNPGKMFFALIILVIISLFIWLLSRKVWLYSVIFGVFTVTVGIINCVKLSLNGNYLVPWDVVMIKTTGELMSFTQIELPPLVWVFVPIIILFWVFFYMCDTSLPLKWYIRVPSAFALVLAVFLIWNSSSTSRKILKNFGLYVADANLQPSNYTSNGFFDAFMINVCILKDQSPEGYNESTVTRYLKNCKGIDAEQSPDVIVILSEAFWDPKKLNGTEFSQNPTVNFEKISARKNAASGNMMVSTISGGTVRTEFDVLTAMLSDNLRNATSPYVNLHKDTATCVRNYKEQGYKTIGVHTYNGSFYSRDEAYPYLGFDEFITEDEISENYDMTFRNSHITDKTFMNVIADTLDKNQDSPVFLFGISMENHQPYNKLDEKDIVIDVKNDKLEPEVLERVESYTQGIYFADRALKQLVDYIDSRDRPTVLLYFGDHLPSLGAELAAYNQAGNVDGSDGYSTEEREYLYSTPFLVYSNYGADLSAFEQSDKISTYYMLPLLAKSTHTAVTPYMEYMADNFALLPYYNKAINNPMNEEQKEFIKSTELLTYDRVSGKDYSAGK